MPGAQAGGSAPSKAPAAIVSLSEMQKMQASLLPESQKEDVAKKRAYNLHLASKQRASTWTNTLEGSRAKNLADRQKKLEKEELGTMVWKWVLRFG